MPATNTPTKTSTAPAARGAASSAATKTAAHEREPNADDSLISLIEARLGSDTEAPEAGKKPVARGQKPEANLTDQRMQEVIARRAAAGEETEEERAAREADEEGETPEERAEREATEAEPQETPEEKAEREAAEAAAEETPEEKAEREAAEVANRVPPGVQKRFDELTRTIHDLRRELKSERETDPARPTPARNASQIEQMVHEATTPAEVARLTETLQDLEDQAIAKRDGGEFSTGGDKPMDLDAQGVANLLVNIRRALRLVPGRLTALQATRDAEAAAVAVYPSLADPESAEGQEYATLVRTHPELRNVPGLKLLVADARAQRLAREAKAKEGRRNLPGKPVLRAGAVPALPGVSARRHMPVPPKIAAQAATYERAKQTGREGDLVSLIESRLGA